MIAQAKNQPHTSATPQQPNKDQNPANKTATMQPEVTVIIPTTIDRKKFNEQITVDFHYQDYENKKVLFDYSEEKIGVKRNSLCKAATGEIIVMMDSDDRYAPDWISRCVEALIETGADIVGNSEAIFYHIENNKIARYTYASQHQTWLCGATLAFRKSLWARNPFPEEQIGEDWGFIYGYKSSLKPILRNMEYYDGFLASIHTRNTSPKIIDGIRWKWVDEEEDLRVKELWGLTN